MLLQGAKCSFRRAFWHARPCFASAKAVSDRLHGSAVRLQCQCFADIVHTADEGVEMDSLSQFSLAGKRALITGSSRGIGFAIAAALAGAGADIILNSRDTETLGKAAADLADSGARARGVAFDVTSKESVNDAIDFIESEIGAID